MCSAWKVKTEFGILRQIEWKKMQQYFCTTAIQDVRPIQYFSLVSPRKLQILGEELSEWTSKTTYVNDIHGSQTFNKGA
jgi:hypothetical protein